MEAITCAKVIECLKSIGIGQNDGLMVNAAFHYLGKPENGVCRHYEARCSIF